MPKEIELILGEPGITSTAILKEDVAPKTCKAVLDVLPAEGQTLHAKWCGNEIWMKMPSMPLIDNENETIFPNCGDLLLVKIAPHIFHLAIFYGKGWCFGPSGFIPANHFATIQDNFIDFSKQCEKVLLEGRKRLIIKEKN